MQHFAAPCNHIAIDQKFKLKKLHREGQPSGWPSRASRHGRPRRSPAGPERSIHVSSARPQARTARGDLPIEISCGDEPRFLILTAAGWVNHHQEDVIDYLREENRVQRPRAMSTTEGSDVMRRSPRGKSAATRRPLSFQESCGGRNSADSSQRKPSVEGRSKRDKRAGGHLANEEYVGAGSAFAHDNPGSEADLDQSPRRSQCRRLLVFVARDDHPLRGALNAGLYFQSMQVLAALVLDVVAVGVRYERHVVRRDADPLKRGDDRQFAGVARSVCAPWRRRRR